MMTRNDKGQFVKGNGGGPGRPTKKREDKFYEILVSTVTVGDWADIIRRAISDAKRGDASARTWLSNYYAGPPVEHKVVTGENGGPVILEVVYGE